MPFIERYLGEIIRIETTTREEQFECASRTAQMLKELIKEQPVFGMAIYLPDAIARERVRTVFVFGKPIHRVTILDTFQPDQKQRTFYEDLAEVL